MPWLFAFKGKSSVSKIFSSTPLPIRLSGVFKTFFLSFFFANDFNSEFFLLLVRDETLAGSRPILSMFASTAAFAVVSDVVGSLSSLIMVDADLLAAIVADVDRTSPLSAIDDGDDDFSVSAIPVDSK